MSHYRGFGFHRVPRTGPVTVLTRTDQETGSWSGFGSVGMMPDLPCAKAYVDWLHDVGPEEAPVPSIEGGVEGHVVVVNGSAPDEDALFSKCLAGIATALRDPALDKAGVERAAGALIRAIRSIDIAADQNRPARAIDNFFLASKDKDGIRYESLHLGNFGFPGEWNGNGLIAVGIGDGWAPKIAQTVMAKRVMDFPDMHIGTAEAPTRYARSVFVAGPEPKIDASSREDLACCQAMLRHVYGWVVTPEVAEYLSSVPGMIEAVAAQLEASHPEWVLPKTPAPAFAPRL